VSEPPPTAVEYFTPAAPSKDEEHLRLLSLFHYICGGVIAAFSSFALIHVGLGIAMIVNPSAFAGQGNTPPPPPFVGWIFLIAGGATLLFGWTVGVLTIVSGRMIRARRRWLFSMIIAGVDCLWMPFGTILGIFTFVILSRATVKAIYRASR
jgi:hypothetical protein